MTSSTEQVFQDEDVTFAFVTNELGSGDAGIDTTIFDLTCKQWKALKIFIRHVLQHFELKNKLEFYPNK